MKKRIVFMTAALLALCLLLTACGSGKNGGDAPSEAEDPQQEQSAGDEQYESRRIIVSGAGVKDELSVSVAELRAMEQHKLDASYRRTTGLYEEFKMEGPYLADVFSSLGLDLSACAAIGVEGTDGYYCLIPADIISQTPDLMLAVKIDGQAVLGEDKAPAMLAVQGQFGPYWVKMVDRITIYDKIPEKEITSVWVFRNLVDGIEPYMYEYYGSRDAAIEFSQILSRFDKVDSDAFLTMKSSDGFLKNETLRMVNHGYYIKYEGEDAPTNVSVNIQLGMNVQNIAWLSTNADAVIFPEELPLYMDLKTVAGKTGVPLSEVLFETGMKQITGVSFDVIGRGGEKVTADGADLYKAVLVCGDDGSASVVWDPALGYADIPELMRVRVSAGQADPSEDGKDKDKDKNEEDDKDKDEDKDKDKDKDKEDEKDVKGPDDILTITGDGVRSETYWSMAEVKALGAYGTTSYSAVNNWPTRKTYYANGVTLGRLLDAAGLTASWGTITITASDGVYIRLTFDQALGYLWSFPYISSESSAGAFSVPAMMAWTCYEEGRAGGENGSLRLVIGQHGTSDVNTSAWISDVIEIDVSTSSYYAWGEPSPSLQPGEVPAGSELSLYHDSIDRVKIYYTTDGSAPTYYSRVYNPSTTYYQPQLTVPIPIDGDMTVRVLVSGWGRPDAEYSYSYTIAAQQPPEEQTPEDQPPEEQPPEDQPPEDQPPEDQPPEDQPAQPGGEAA